MADYYMHESSYVDEGAEIGKGTKIWHYCHIMSKAQIGENCNIGQNVFIASYVKIGNNVKIQNNVSVYTGVIVEDDVFLGPSIVFTNVINPRGHIPRKNEYKMTRVGRGVTIGANATVVCGVNLGIYSFVGAGSVLTHDLPDYSLAYGNPARIRGWMCQCGTRLKFDRNDIAEIAICEQCGSSYFKVGQSVKLMSKEVLP